MEAPFRIPDTVPPRERVQLLETLASEGSELPAVRALAATFRGSRRDRAAQVLAAAQTWPYHPDPAGEWFQAVEYTLINGGDCEDLTALAAALAIAADVPTSIEWVDLASQGQPMNHVSLMLDTAEPHEIPRWEWAEVTVPAFLGEEPLAAAERTGHVERLGVPV